MISDYILIGILAYFKNTNKQEWVLLYVIRSEYCDLIKIFGYNYYITIILRYVRFRLHITFTVFDVDECGKDKKINDLCNRMRNVLNDLRDTISLYGPDKKLISTCHQ